MERLVPLVRRRRQELALLISHKLPLEEGPEAYRLFDSRAAGCTKVVLRPWPAAGAASPTAGDAAAAGAGPA